MLCGLSYQDKTTTWQRGTLGDWSARNNPPSDFSNTSNLHKLAKDMFFVFIQHIITVLQRMSSWCSRCLFSDPCHVMAAYKLSYNDEDDDDDDYYYYYYYYYYHYLLSASVRAATSLSMLRQELKTFLFHSLVTMDIIINLFHPCTFFWPSAHILLTM